MTLKELAETYREEDRLIQTYIKRARSLLKTSSGEELVRLRRKLLTLYDMSRDLRDVAYILENYYGDEVE